MWKGDQVNKDLTPEQRAKLNELMFAFKKEANKLRILKEDHKIWSEINMSRKEFEEFIDSIIDEESFAELIAEQEFTKSQLGVLIKKNDHNFIRGWDIINRMIALGDYDNLPDTPFKEEEGTAW